MKLTAYASKKIVSESPQGDILAKALKSTACSSSVDDGITAWFVIYE